jgi:D-lactate dehydrogenase (cytochrome)
MDKIDNAEKLANYQSDESSVFTGCADTLFLPENEAALVETIKNANINKTFITISGAGTGLTGARVPIYGGTIISTEKIKRPQVKLPNGFREITDQGFTLFLNENTKEAVVPSSIPLATLDQILKPFNLSYPPDPTELSATIGGTVATNASGARSFHYGATRNWISGLRIILATGETIDIKRNQFSIKNNILSIPAGNSDIKFSIPDTADYNMPQTKNAAGLYLKNNMDPIDLFIGSEGILGCFTDINIKLINRIDSSFTVIAFFESINDALLFTDSEINKKETNKYLSLELFDFGSLDLLRAKYPSIPKDISAAILFELQYDDDDDDDHLLHDPSLAIINKIDEELIKYSSKCNWAISSNQREKIRIFRHTLPETINEVVKSLYGKIGTDMAVPHKYFNEMMAFYKKTSSTATIPYVMFGHIGNDHIHLNYLPKNKAQVIKAKESYALLAKKAVELGGTISAEHGVGKKTITDGSGNTTPYLELLYGKKGLKIISDIKALFDPNLILNIGNMIPTQTACIK